MMDSILRETEAYQFFALGGRFRTVEPVEGHHDLQNAVSLAAAQLSRNLLVRCVFVLTRTGLSAREVSSDRPAAPIIAITQIEPIYRRLHLLWGVYPFLVHKELATEEYLALGEKIIKKLKLAKRGDCVLMLSSVDLEHAVTNSIVAHRIS